MHFFLRTRDLLVSQKMTLKHFISTLYPLSMVIFATATVLAFVLLHDSRFSFHCYTQHEATPTQKLARKCAATSHDFFRERLQSAFTLGNQLRWITCHCAHAETRFCDFFFKFSPTPLSGKSNSIKYPKISGAFLVWHKSKEIYTYIYNIYI